MLRCYNVEVQYTCNIRMNILNVNGQCCIRRDGTGTDSECAFIYSDNLVIIR